MVDYIVIENPLTFEDILELWVGEQTYSELKEYEPYNYFFRFSDYEINEYCKCNGYEEYILNTIRCIEIQLESKRERGYIHIYKKRNVAGRDVFFELPYASFDELFKYTREGWRDDLCNFFVFMDHSQIGMPLDPLYFKKEEILSVFPFLNNHEILKKDYQIDNTKNQLSNHILNKEDIMVKVGGWYALEPTNEAIHVGLRRLQQATYSEIYREVFGEFTGEFTKAMQEKIRRRWCSFLNLAEDRGIPRKTLEDMVSPQ